MKKENNLIQILSFLAVQMEDSETQLINAIAPGTLPEYERPRHRNERREPLVADEPRYKTEMVEQVVKKNQLLAEYLDVTPLQIEVTEDSMFSDASIVLTDKGKQLFLEEDYDLFSTDSRSQSLIYPDKIAGKTLFYDKELSEQLELFKENLVDEKFSELQQRLEEQALPKGVAALFHGLPGTGKTETAMQIARATGRAVCHVDISEAKTCWYGESQKLVKGIFTNYRRLCEKEKQKPILLFNEADALLSSRQNINNASGSSSVAQTENAIQNIILEEMENLDGILIATTNLTDNLDSAFARRFLFKIKFGQPTEEAKQSIWKSKLSWLTDEDCRQLAAHHDFSGGEIDNIVRKVVMEEVLHGTRPALAEIEELCRHEKIGNGGKGNCIGFLA